jgi:hypothetical protein
MYGMDETMSRFRSMHVFKTVAMMVEEAKFEDVTREIVDTILNQPDLKLDIGVNKRRV